MKKSILLLAVAAMALTSANAAAPLKCLWKNTGVASLETDARQGVGVNGYMYLQNHTTMKLEVWNEEGKANEYATANTTNVNRDDAGNVIVRLTPVFPNGAATETIRVFDTNGSMATTDFTLTGAPAGRADFYGHVAGNVLSADGGIMAHGGNWLGNFGAWNINNGDAAASSYAFSTLANANIKVDGTFTTTHQIGAYSFMPGELALLTPHYQKTNSTSGYGNSIYRLAQDVTGAYVPSGFFATPNHNGCSGYDIFECDGNKYIVYSTGANMGDGFTVAKLIVKDSPANDQADADAVVAVKYADYNNEAGTEMYKNNAFYGNHLNAEVAGNHKVHIYQYCPKAYIAMFELDLTAFAPTAIEDVNAEATVVGIYNLQGMRLNEMSEGINIVQMSDGTTRKIIK